MYKYRIKVFEPSMFLGSTRYMPQWRPVWWPFWESDYYSFDTEVKALEYIEKIWKSPKKPVEYIYVD